MIANGSSMMWFYESEEMRTAQSIVDAQQAIDDFRNHFTQYDTLYEKKCELYRREEINLYYQCTQNDYNNYALDHYGGDMRSYPRWLCEFCRCNDRLRKAQHTRVEGRWCEPSTYQPRWETCGYCGADPVPFNDNPYPEPETGEPTFKYLPNFSGYWIMREQDESSPRTALNIELIQDGVCVDQVPNPEDYRNSAVLTHYKTGTNTPVEINDIRLRDGEYIEATILPGGERMDFDTQILTFGYLPINEQNVHEHIHDNDSVPYHPHGVYFTKVGSCDNRGAEKLWQFQLFPEVESGLIGEWVYTTDDVHHDEESKANDDHHHH